MFVCLSYLFMCGGLYKHEGTLPVASERGKQIRFRRLGWGREW